MDNKFCYYVYAYYVSLAMSRQPQYAAHPQEKDKRTLPSGATKPQTPVDDVRMFRQAQGSAENKHRKTTALSSSAFCRSKTTPFFTIAQLNASFSARTVNNNNRHQGLLPSGVTKLSLALATIYSRHQNADLKSRDLRSKRDDFTCLEMMQ